jgi:SAM-dependent methyltransferase
MGYQTFGFDLCADFIDLARRRVADDSTLQLTPPEILSMFQMHDIEAAPLSPQLRDSFDAAIVESCLHHFLDPVAALRHIAQTIKRDGVLVLIEGENRQGSIKQEYMAVMREFHTLERPYPRDLLCDALSRAGFDHVEFVAPLHGWYSPNDPAATQLAEIHRQMAGAMNLAICAKTAAALQRIFPWRAEMAPSILPVGASEKAAPQLEKAAPQPSEGWLRRLVRRMKRRETATGGQ